MVAIRGSFVPDEAGPAATGSCCAEPGDWSCGGGAVGLELRRLRFSNDMEGPRSATGSSLPMPSRASASASAALPAGHALHRRSAFSSLPASNVLKAALLS